MEKAKEMGAGALAITGNIDFYGKSGFVPAKTKGVRYADDPEADYFLIKELTPGFLDGISGTYKDPEGYFVCEKDPEGFERFEATFPKKEKRKLPGQLLLKQEEKMASSKEYLHFILEQLSDLDDISYRPMMGEFILYYRGKIVGGIYDDRLLVKKTRSALELMPAAICELPYEGAKEMLLVDEVDSKVFLTKLFEAMYDELPSPKRKNNGIGGITDELYSDHKRKY